MKRLAAGLLGLTVALLLAEGILRLQQAAGPWVELKSLSFPSDEELLSDRFHHRPPGKPEGYVGRAQFGSGCRSGVEPVRLLFLGDSWVQSGGPPEGVGRAIERAGGGSVCVETLNGGVNSYAPSPILLRGEFLMGIHRPQLVFVNIDETDLMDETVRYKDTAVRDGAGRLDRLLPGKDMYLKLVVNAGYKELEQYRSYVVRLLLKLYHTRVFTPRFARLLGAHSQRTHDDLLAPQRSPDPRVSHAAEVEHFRRIVREMLERLTAKLGGRPQRLLVSHHPHLAGVPGAAVAQPHNRIVSEVVEEECRRLGVPFWDARDHILEMYGPDYRRFFTLQDPFSHLTPEGSIRYGESLAKAFWPHLQEALRTH